MNQFRLVQAVDRFSQRVIVDIVLNDAYQQIIGLGPAALPLIIRELEKNGGQWFWALRMIARQAPVPKELRGETKQMAEAWFN
ncbi:hypothetical protein QZM22_22440 [Burkholderia oklahomensis]|uniref:hypothetical protein n=1 Tax=Burkholderia oklahomensis TaxID=342113 RepID=UPI00265260A3|nr:hypothetical protein [Burkholderia oklahomensis]MDN7675198.1 hypothetical protein [Burkholderia oklahomensis]